MEKRLLAYVRQSKKGNSEYSHTVQEKAIRAFIKAHSLPEIEEVFREDASAKTALSEQSGQSIRKKFDKLMTILEEDSENTMENRKYQWVIFFDVSRISRNSSDFVTIENLMKKWYRMYSVRENIVDSPAGLYFFRMAQIEAIYYSERQSSKIRLYRFHKIKHDPRAWMWWKDVTYWYMVKKGRNRQDSENDDTDQNSEWNERISDEKNRVSIHPVNSKIVKRIFELTKSGIPQAGIRSRLVIEFKDSVDEFNASPLWQDYTDASIPSTSDISEILHNDNEFKYDWHRTTSFNMIFEEDAKMLNMSGDLPNGITFEKWENNRLNFEIPEFRIISDDLYVIAAEKIDRRSLFQEHKTRESENIKLFNNIKCSCWAKITGNSWAKGFWYGCMSARQKKEDSCQFQQEYLENDIVTFLNHEVFQYLRLKDWRNELFDAYIWERETKLRTIVRQNEVILDAYLSEIREFEEGGVASIRKEKRIEKLVCKTIPEKEAEINEYNSELALLTGESTWQKLFWLRKALTHFWTMSRWDQRVLYTLVIKSITMWEIHDGKHLYENTNGVAEGTIRQQKIIQKIEFNGPFQEIFLYNRYWNNV